MVLGSGVFSPAAARFLSVFRISVFCCLFFFFPGGRPAAPLSLSARVVRGCPDTRVPGGRRHLQVATPPSPFRHWRSSPLPGPLTHALPCSPAATPPEGHARRPSLDPLPLPPSLSLQNVLPPRTATGRPSISSAQKRHPNSPSPRVRGGLPPLGRATWPPCRAPSAPRALLVAPRPRCRGGPPLVVNIYAGGRRRRRRASSRRRHPAREHAIAHLLLAAYHHPPLSSLASHSPPPASSHLLPAHVRSPRSPASPPAHSAPAAVDGPVQHLTPPARPPLHLTMTRTSSPPASPPRGSPPGSPVSSPSLPRSLTTPARPARRPSKRPRTSIPPRTVAAAAAAAGMTTTDGGGDDGNGDGGGGAVGSTPSPAKGVVKTRAEAAAGRGTPASVMVRQGPAGRSAAGRRRRSAASAVSRRLVLDFGTDGADTPAAAADAAASVRAATANLSAAVADGFAARWDFDIRRGEPVQSPSVWHWSSVEVCGGAAQ